MLLEELELAKNGDNCLNIIKEFHDYTKKYQFNVHKNNKDSWGKWSMMDIQEELRIEEEKYRKTLHGGIVYKDDLEVPVHMIEIAKDTKEDLHSTIAIKKAAQVMKNRQGAINKLASGTSETKITEGIRIRKETIKVLEKRTNREIVEWGVDCLTRSLNRVYKESELLKIKNTSNN